MAWQSAQDRNMPAADLGMFTARTRTHTDSPPLKIGYLMDVSGSMVHASQPMSVAQWMLAAAGQRIDAQVATAHFGVTSYGVARAGQAKPQVDLWQCLDGWERPYRAWLALDAELDLLTSTGPRLLVIASDARWSRRDERSYMEGAMLQARKAGLSVMWLDVTGKFRRHPWHYGEIVPIQGLSSAEVAELIGQRAVRLLSEARR